MVANALLMNSVWQDDQTDGNKARIRLDREESLRLSQKGEEMLKKAEVSYERIKVNLV
jgi:hypothetical protein